MGANISIGSADDFNLGVYVAEPSQAPSSAVIVIQEIFGVNQHIREVADGYAAAGHLAIAPKLFDRIDRNIELGYDSTAMTEGISLAFSQLNMELALHDIQAAVDFALTQVGSVAVVGYCFGGLMAWQSACLLPGVAAASCYYGGGIAGHLELIPRCPIMMHFGELDPHIPLTDVAKIEQAQAAVQVHVYAADHGFNCDHRASYEPNAAALARERTLAFFAEHLTA